MRSPTAKPSFKLTFTAATQLSRKVRETLGDVLVAPPNEEEADGNQASPQERVTYRVACDYVLQATGASREGHAWAASLGHDVSPPVPSLFTFTINDPRQEYHGEHRGTGVLCSFPRLSRYFRHPVSCPFALILAHDVKGDTLRMNLTFVVEYKLASKTCHA